MNTLRKRRRRAKVAIRRAVGLTQWRDDLEGVEAREAVVRALAPLRPGQRAAIVLTNLLGYT
jgi:DNA-directed RNA polymerase specialized sigma24 family protein